MTNEIARKIRSAGYYGTSISSFRFEAERIPLGELLPIIEKCQINFRGREFPMVDRTQRVPDRSNSISQRVARVQRLETWRFFQSGQFTDLRGMPNDWLDEMPGGSPFENWKKREFLYVEHVLVAFGEIFEFAARLSNTAAGDEHMEIEITVGGLHGRRLSVADEFNHLDQVGRSEAAAVPEFRKTYRYSKTQLLAEARSLSVEATQPLFALFDKTISTNLLRGWSNEALGSW